MLKKLKQRGQILVFYAFMIPTIFLLIGAAADLGWYYLNVSRLQNAADAAVLAGSQALVSSGQAFDNYYLVSLANNSLPADFDDYRDVFKNTFDSSTSSTGKLNNYKSEKEISSTLNAGRYLAEQYTRKNLSDDTQQTGASNLYSLSAKDGWNVPSNDSANDSERKVTGKLELKYKIVDGKNNVYGPLYYVVNLEKQIRHFLLSGWFDPMKAKVKAVALLKPRYISLLEPIQQLERTKVIDNWEYTNKYQGTTGAYDGKWGHYQAGKKSDKNYGIRYTSGNSYRQESVIVKATKSPTDNKDVTTSAGGTSLKTTKANGDWVLDVNEVDSINIDFRAEVGGKFTSDWDLGYAFKEKGHSYYFTNNNSWSATDGADKRILFNTEFDEAFPTRDDSLQADPLWVRIESDPIKNPYTGAGVGVFNSVRQITLNFNDDNTSVAGSGSNQYYEYRPYFIFYTGPENIDSATDENGVLIRHSQPVILNLNENLNAIIYMPNSPVIINGNGNELHGFVIAKCFLKTVTSEDMRNGVILWDGFNAPENFRLDNFTEGTDASGSTVYFNLNELVTRGDINAHYSGDEYTITDDGASKILTVKKMLQATKYILLNYTKADSQTYEVKTNGQHDENKTFAAYVNATYKETFKNFSGLSDSQITAVTFPNENYNETTATYYVDTTDLSPTKVDDNYVKVKAGSATKYVDKKNLPYVKVRTNDQYFYVCVADLQLLKDSNGNSNGNKGIRMVDAVDEKDIYVNPTSIDKYGDSWKIDRPWFEKAKEYINWKKDKVEFGEKNGVAYFMLKAEMSSEAQIIAKYYQMTTKSGGVYYAKDGDNLYFTKFDNNNQYPENDKNKDNYIIVDEHGNVLTKPVTAPEVFTVKTKDDNDSLDISTPTLGTYWSNYTRDPKDPEEIPSDRGTVTSSGKYVGSSYRARADYRIPALERVYNRSTFNLSEDSCYSFFYIDELWRVNYTYMNVDEFGLTVNRVVPDNDSQLKVEDMFFVYNRAAWID
ncbi:MAG: Tad domain-containing protein [Selenomonadaceae bacterium]|nr:Tad domain-containing protein [Selenomonadaceae bacterium]